MATDKRWQDGINVLFGIWLFFSPWILGFYSSIPAASGNFFVVGIAVIVFAVIAMNVRTAWEEWVNFALGIWMIISPWVAGYSANVAARDNAVILGVLTAVVSFWAYYDQSHGGTPAVTH